VVLLLFLLCSVVDQQRFDADPKPSVCFDADKAPILSRTKLETDKKMYKYSNIIAARLSSIFKLLN
jgi:hypothetical protein